MPVLKVFFLLVFLSGLFHAASCVGSTQNFTCGEAGEVTESCTMNGNLSSDGTCFQITESDITIDCNGFSIQGDGGNGIYAEEVSNITVQNCTISDFSHGIHLSYYVYDSKILNNVIRDCSERGIVLEYSYDNLFINNTNELDYSETDQKFYSDSSQLIASSGNIGWWPLPGSDGSDADDQENTAWYNGTSGGRDADGTPNPYLTYWYSEGPVCVGETQNFTCGDEVTESCTMNGNISFDDGTCFEISESDITIDCNGFSIAGDGGPDHHGIYTESMSNITIQNCTIHDFWVGIYLVNSIGINVSNNIVYGNLYGIYLDSSPGINASNNLVYGNEHTGFYASYSDNNLFINNTVHSNGYGFYFEYSDSNNLTDNVIYNSSSSGIYTSYSSNNLFINNTNELDYSETDQKFYSDSSQLIASSGNIGWWPMLHSDGSDADDQENTAWYNGTSGGRDADGTPNPYLTYWYSEGPVCVGETQNFTCGDEVTESCTMNGNVYILGSTCFDINDDDITIDCAGFRISGDNTDSTYGISVSAVSGASIRNCTIRYFQEGIYLAGSNSSVITNNIVYDNNDGIVASYSNGNIFESNIVHSNLDHGFLFEYSDSNNLTDNVIYESSSSGIYTSYSSNNLFINNSNEIWYGETDQKFYSDSSQLIASSGNIGWWPLLDSNGSDADDQTRTAWYGASSGMNADGTFNGSLHYWYDNQGPEYPVCVGSTQNFTCGEEVTESCTMNGNLSIINSNCFTIDSEDITIDCNGFSIASNADYNGISVYASNATIQNCTISNFSIGIHVYDYAYDSRILNSVIRDCFESGVYLDSSPGINASNNLVYGNVYGFYASYGDNNLFINNTVHSNNYGFYFIYSASNNLTDNVIYDTSSGIYMEYSSNNLFTNNTNELDYSETDQKFYSDSSQDTASSGNIGWWPLLSSDGSDATDQENTAWYNRTSGGRDADGTPNPTLMYWYSNKPLPGSCVGATQTFVCGETVNESCVLIGDLPANGSTCFSVGASNIEIDCNGNSITGNNTLFTYGIYSNKSNTTVRNCIISGFDAGIYINSTGAAVLESNTINVSTNNVVVSPYSSGILIYSGSGYNSLINNTAYSQYGNAIYLYSSSRNNITNCTASSYGARGIFLTSSSNNNIVDSSGYSSTNHGLRLQLSNSNSIVNSNGTSNTSYGIYLVGANANSFTSSTSASNKNTALRLASASNNLFTDCTNSISYSGKLQMFHSNYAQDISSYGNTGWWPLLNSSGSDTITQSKTAWYNGSMGGRNANGAANSSLHYWYGNQVTIGCIGATQIFVCGDEVTESCTMTGNLSSDDETCFEITESDITIDCNGFSIQGEDSSSGIYVGSVSNVTVQNCMISNFNEGVYFSDYTYDSRILNNVIRNCSEYGIYLTGSSEGINVSNNIVYENNYGIYASYSNRNVFKSNTVHSNLDHGFYLVYSSSNNLTDNVIYNTMGIYLEYGSNNLFTNNTNELDYSETDQKFYAHSVQDTSSYGNIGWWPLLDSDGEDADSQENTAWYNGTSGGRNYDGSENLSLQYWYMNQSVAPPTSACIGETQNFTCGQNVTESCILNGAVSIDGSTCFTLGADNIALDCNGYSITGDATGSTYGIYARGRNNITIQNCLVSSFDTGILMQSSNNSIINNTISSGSSKGLFIYDGYNNRINNLTASGTQNGIRLETLDPHNTNNILTGCVGTSNSGYGILVYVAQNNTIINSNFTSNTSTAFWLYSAYNTLTNVSAYSRTNAGITLSSSFNTITDSTFASNSYNGMYVSSSNNIIVNSIISSNTSQGIFFYSNSNNNQIINSTGTSNTKAGIFFRSSSNNQIINSTGASNEGTFNAGIFLNSSSNNNQIINSYGISNSSQLSGYGIYLGSSSNNTIANSYGATGATGGGAIFLGDYSSNNTIVNSTGASNTTSGIYVASVNFGNQIINSYGISNGNGAGMSILSRINITNSTGSSNGSYGILMGCSSAGSIIIGSTFNSNSGTSVYLVDSSTNNLFINCTNSIDYNGTSQKFYSNSASQNVSSHGNVGWWPMLNSNGSNAKVQANTSWYNGTSGGRNANGSENASLQYWYGNQTSFAPINYSACVGATRNFVCGQTITESCTMNGNVSINGSTCFTIGADNIEIDCNGFSIGGDATEATYGVYAESISNISVQNCTIHDFEEGAYFSSSTESRILNSIFYNCSYDGIFLEDSSSINCSNNIVRDNQAGFDISSTGGSVFDNNTFYGNSARGLYVQDASVGNVFTNNVLYNNSNYSIYLASTDHFSIFINNTNELDYNGTEQMFYSDSSQNISSSGNIGWWPLLNSNGSDATSQEYTAWYNGTERGRNADGTENLSLQYWYGNNFATGCVGATQTFVCGQTITESCTMNGNVSAAGTNCFAVTAENVSIDCGGYTISGNNTLNTSGIYTNQFNTSVRNCNINGFDVGIYFNTTDNGTIENNNVNSTVDNTIAPTYSSAILLYNGANFNTINNNTAYSQYGFGIYLDTSSNNQIINSTGTAGTYRGIYLSASSNNTIINSTGTAGTCRGIYFSSSSNNQIINSNGIATTFYGGIYLSSSSNNTIINSTGTAGSYGGIYLDTSSNNQIINSTGTAISSSGIYLYTSSNNTIINSTGTAGTYGGIQIQIGSNNIIANSQIKGKDNTNGALLIHDASTNNTIANSTINGLANKYAITLQLGSNTGNRFINNTIFNATNLLYFDANASSNIFCLNNFSDSGTAPTTYINDTNGSNYYNCTYATLNQGNIYSNVLNGSVEILANPASSSSIPGLYIGSFGSGYPYNSTNSGGKIAGTAADYAPLTSITHYGCVGATTTFLCGQTITESCTMNGNISINGSTCFTMGANDTVLDCNGFSIGGDGTNYGIHAEGVSNISVQNCTIHDFVEGVYIYNSTESTILNNVFYNCSSDGIYLEESSGVNVSNNVIRDSQYGAIYLYLSSRNIFRNNTVSGTSIGFGIQADDSSNSNVFEGNLLYGNSYGIYLSSSSGNLFVNNTNQLDYNETNHMFQSYSAQNISSYGNTGWWPLLTSNGSDATSQEYTAWYNGTEGGRNADGSANSSLSYWYGNSGPQAACVGLNYKFVCGETINESCTMYGDLTINGSTCLRVGASNIEIDCNSYSLTGNNTLFTYGIYSNKSNTTVRNCIIRRFDAGIYINSTGAAVLESNTINVSTNNVVVSPYSSGILIYSGSGYNSLINNTAYSQYGNAIYLYSSSRNNITNCTASSYGARGIFLTSSSNNNIVDSSGYSSTNHGLRLQLSNSNSIVNSNGTSNTSYGIYLVGANANSFTGSTSASNKNTALRLASASSNLFTDCTNSISYSGKLQMFHSNYAQDISSYGNTGWWPLLNSSGSDTITQSKTAWYNATAGRNADGSVNESLLYWYGNQTGPA